MNKLRESLARFGGFFNKRRKDRELEEEIESHIQMHIEDNVRLGMTPMEARRQALIQFGGIEVAKESYRDQRGVPFLETFFQDIHFGVRLLSKSPGFTTLAVLILGLGIAANTTIFSFVNMLLLPPPPVEKPAELWQVWRESLKSQSALERFQGLSYPGFTYFREHNHSFIALAGFDPETPFVSWSREGIGEPIQCQFVSGNFFDVCGLRMALGRPFRADEDRQPGAAPLAVVSHAFWQKRLGGDPAVVGRSLRVNGVSLTVVGVAPEGFTGLIAGLAPDFWAPFMMAGTVVHDAEWHTRTGSFSLFGLGRLKSQVSPRQAAADLTLLTRQLEELDSRNNRNYAAVVFPSTMIPTPFRGFVGAFTAMLMAAVILVLLIVCANVANMTLARSVARRQELAVRASIGASRGRLIRHLLTESLLLALMGGAAGLLLSSAVIPLLLSLVPPTLPIRPAVSLDFRVFAFTVALSLVTCLIFGFVPAWRSARLDLATVLKDNAARCATGRSRFMGALVITQVAVCLTLLICASLCLRSLFNAQNVSLGFSLHQRVVAEVHLKNFAYSQTDIDRFNSQMIEALSLRPEFQSVAFADYLPLDARFLGITFNVEGRQPPAGQNGYNLQTFDVGPGYLKTMGSVLLRGREFRDSDREGMPQVAIINRAMADQFWPGENPVGRRLLEGKPGEGDSYEIVGVVETGKYRTLGETPRAVVFRSRLQHPGPRSTFVAEIQGDSQQALNRIRDEVQRIDPRLSVARLLTLEQHLALALFPARTTGLLFGVLGAVALMLAVAGLFAVIAYSVSQRTREIGIRMALGAKRGDVQTMVLRQGLVLAGTGVIVGLCGAAAASQLLRGLLYGISAVDPFSFATVPLLLLTAALLACWLPARRASNVHPNVALRCD